MLDTSLSMRDLNVLEKMQDPESDPSQQINIRADAPPDPNIVDEKVYQSILVQEIEIYQAFERSEAAFRDSPSEAARAALVQQYQQGVSKLDSLLKEFDNYASARNNRAQALRRLYGDQVLIGDPPQHQGMIDSPTATSRCTAAGVILDDLARCIQLLTPQSPRAPISRQAARTLAAAHTQRGAIYHQTAKLLDKGHHLDMVGMPHLAGWTSFEFENAASADFAKGGRYGSEIARALAVSTNSTAKLCGEMVRNAMMKEYGEDFVR